MPGLTEQQQLAVVSESSKILVCAGAGSGKTHVLVERYIERLKRDATLGVNSLIAVTFTRKAANEMRVRLKKRLRELLESSPLEERERWSQCLCEIDGARIGTIHSLCETIIKTFPLDAGVDPQLEVLDELEQARLLNESINAVFRDVIEQQSSEHELMLEYDMNQIREWLTKVLKSSLQFQEAVVDISGKNAEQLIEFAEKTLASARRRALKALTSSKRFGQAIAAMEQVSETEMTASLNDHRIGAIGYASTALNVGEILAAGDACDEEKILSAWQSLTELSLLKPGNTGGNKDDAKLTRASIKALREVSLGIVAKIPPELTDSDNRAFDYAARFLSLVERARLTYANAKRERFTADYNDLIALALTALERENSAARRHYSTLTAEIMVDEFQDTNRVQATLLALLAGPETTMFLIGDDKQSIYKFQGADVSTFNNWKQTVKNDANGSLLSLSTSFRSHPDIVAFVNALFSDLMGDESRAGLFDASFQSLLAARKDEPSDLSNRVEVVCYSDGAIEQSSSGAEQNRRAEAKAVADYILEKVAARAVVNEKGGAARPIKYGDFAVLVQRNKDFSWIETALIKAKIPYVMMGGRNFLDRQEIYDIENLLTFLAAPLNDHALLGALRSPMFAIGDDLLHGMITARTSGSGLWSAMLSVAKSRKPGYESVRRAVVQMKQLFADASRLQLSDLLRKIIERTGYDVILLGLPNGKQRSRNLWKLVALSVDRQELSCGEFAESLRLMREFNVQQSDAALDTSDSVKLMTIHGSKGLEFPAVLLPVLDASSASRQDRVVYHREYGIAFNTARLESDPKPAYYQVACSINEEMELAEKKRLFYVATTRARDYLGLFFNADGRNTASFRTWLREWLGLNDQEANEGGGSLTKREHLCTLSFVEILEPHMEDREDSDGSSGTSQSLPGPDPVKINWDLVWPAMNGELEAPSPNAGVRITAGASRPHLEAAHIGTVFHALMENLSDDLALPREETLESVAFSHGDVVADVQFRTELLNEARSLVATFFESDLYLQLKSARRRYNEVPYILASMLAHSHDQLGLFDDFVAAPEVAIKRPDLIFEDHQGRWHVVDYKTDRVARSDLGAHLAMHSEQITQYARELKIITGMEFIPSIYFAYLGVLSHINEAALTA